jgi:hypothetical protein
MADGDVRMTHEEKAALKRLMDNDVEVMNALITILVRLRATNDGVTKSTEWLLRKGVTETLMVRRELS